MLVAIRRVAFEAADDRHDRYKGRPTTTTSSFREKITCQTHGREGARALAIVVASGKLRFSPTADSAERARRPTPQRTGAAARRKKNIFSMIVRARRAAAPGSHEPDDVKHGAASVPMTSPYRAVVGSAIRANVRSARAQQNDRAVTKQSTTTATTNGSRAHTHTR